MGLLFKSDWSDFFWDLMRLHFCAELSNVIRGLSVLGETAGIISPLRPIRRNMIVSKSLGKSNNESNKTIFYQDSCQVRQWAWQDNLISKSHLTIFPTSIVTSQTMSLTGPRMTAIVLRSQTVCLIELSSRQESWQVRPWDWKIHLFVKCRDNQTDRNILGKLNNESKKSIFSPSGLE